MRLPGIAALFSALLSITWADIKSGGPTKKPTNIKLEWLETGVGMKITFADKNTDEITLTADPNDNCFFHGSLNKDIESVVEVDGCKGELEIVEISSRFVPCGLVVLLLEDGETYEIDPTEGLTAPDVEDSIPQTAARPGAAWRGDLPNTAVAKIHVRYDNTLLDLMGGHAQAKKKVNTIIAMAQPYFKRSLGLGMDIKIEIVSGPSHYNKHIRDHPSGNTLNALVNQGGRGDDHPTAWFIAAKVNSEWQLSLAGVADIHGLCRGSEAGSINEVAKHRKWDGNSARLFVHELGHNLGMHHDFENGPKHGCPHCPNHLASGCDKRGFMSYQPPELPRKWSTCSKSDLDKTFREWTYRCMASEGGESPETPSGGTCKCNGQSLQGGAYPGAGRCDANYILNSGCRFCFVDRDMCRDAVYLGGLPGSPWASCTPCNNDRNVKPLEVAECPSGSSDLIRLANGLLATGLLVALF